MHDRLADLGAKAITETLEALDDLTAMPQSDDGVTYAHKIEKAEAEIDWSEPAAIVSRKIRGLSPFPGAWTLADGERVKILFAQTADGNGKAGEVLDDQLTIACGEGAVELLQLQRAGKGRMDRETFLNGFQIPKGARLGS